MCSFEMASPSPSPPSPLYDFLVVGVGAMGVSVSHRLAKAGKKVLGLERFSIAHANGSSHGETRITRLAYWEHPSYVPLLKRSFELYREIEREDGGQDKLFHQTGSLDMGPEDDPTFQGSLLSCRTYGLEHDVLTPAQLAARFPAWRIPANYRAVFQPAGGMLFPERLIAATARLARKAGADLREHMEVVDILPTGSGVEVRARNASGQEETFRARRLVLSAGAWLPTLMAKSSLGLASTRIRRLAALIRPERQVVSWYAPDAAASADGRFDPSRFPVWICTHEGVNYYGFPLLAGGQAGVKVGRYHHGQEPLDSESAVSDLEGRQRTSLADSEQTRLFMASVLDGVQAQLPVSSSASPSPPPVGAALHVQTCMFTNTPDEHFLLDPRPDAQLPQVAIISACSGHGFKFCPVVGEAMAQAMLREEGQPAAQLEKDIQWLDAGRLLGDRPPLQNVQLPTLAPRSKL